MARTVLPVPEITSAVPSTYLSPKEVAHEVRLNPRVVYRAINSGELRAARLGGSLRVHRDWLLDWIERAAGRR